MQVKIWQKGLLLVSVPLVFQVVFVSSLIVMQQQTEKLAEQERRDYMISEQSEKLMRSFLEIGSLMVRIERVAPGDFEGQFDKRIADVRQGAQKLTELAAGDPSLEQKANGVRQNSDKALGLMVKLREEKTMMALVDANFWHRELKAAFEDLAAAGHELRQEMRERKAKNPIAAQEARDRMRLAIWSGLGLSAMITVFLAIYFTRNISNRVLTMEQNTYRFLAKQPLLPAFGGTDEISRLDSIFHAMAHSVREAEQRKQEFLEMISHDVRAPLMALLTTLGLIGRGSYGKLSDAGESRVRSAEKSVDRIVDMINQLLDIEKLESGLLKLRYTSKPSEELLSSAVENIKSLAEEKSIKIDTIINSRTPVNADEQRVTQVLINLLANAVKYTPPNGSINLAVDESDSAWEFSVKDSGPGISDHDQKAIFERFVQVDSEDNRKEVGTGLGLAISKGLVEAHGGTISLTSEQGQGATFCFTIPKTQTIKAAEKQPV